LARAQKTIAAKEEQVTQLLPGKEMEYQEKIQELNQKQKDVDAELDAARATIGEKDSKIEKLESELAEAKAIIEHAARSGSPRTNYCFKARLIASAGNTDDLQETAEDVLKQDGHYKSDLTTEEKQALIRDLTMRVPRGRREEYKQEIAKIANEAAADLIAEAARSKKAQNDSQV